MKSFSSPLKAPEKTLAQTLTRTLIASAVFSAIATSTYAADKPAQGKDIEEMVITGITGTPLPLSSIPGAAEIITDADISEQMKISSDIADMMANLLPGYSPSNQLSSNFGQTFRGKKAVVLIDGILQTTPIRNASREFMTIAPEAIETIEVIHGSSALYGNGYAGGVVNFVTRKAGDEFQGWTSVQTTLQPDGNSDTFGWGVNQGFSGPITDSLDYVVNFNYKDTGKFVDAQGDILPEDQSGQGGYANGDQYDVLLKIGYGESDNRLDLTYHRYHMTNGLTYNRKIDPITGFTVIDTSRPYTGEDPSNDVESLQAKWHKEDVLGQTFSIQASIGDNKYKYATTEVDSRKYKLLPQFMYETADEKWRILYGLDLEKDTTTQKLRDGSACWICDVSKMQTSPFAQVWYNINDQWEAQIGVRHEKYSFDIPDYDSVRGALKGTRITGGTLKYSDTVYNGGLVFHVNDNVDLFGGYSEGYAVDDLRRLRGPIENDVKLLKEYLPATKSHNVEIGVRGNYDVFAYSVSLFQTKTDNAAHYGQESDGSFPYEFLIYADEEIAGIEATVDYQFTDNWAAGGSLSFAEGEYDDNVSNKDQPLNGTRITPAKYTFYVAGNLTPTLNTRLQIMHVGNRDEFDPVPGIGGYYYYESPVTDYTTADLVMTYDLHQGQWGELSMAVRNLTNEDYVPASSQIDQQRYTSATAYKAQGRAITLSWSKNY